MSGPNEEVFQRTVGIDFDGVIHQYEGWCDVENDPMPGAFEAIRELHKKYNLVVFCAREWTGHGGCLDQIPPWFEKHNLGIEAVALRYHGHFWNDSERILVTNYKVPAVAYIDDRGIRFWDWEQTLADMEALLG